VYLSVCLSSCLSASVSLKEISNSCCAAIVLLLCCCAHQEILLYRVAVACSLLLRTPRCKSGQMRHLQKLIFSAHQREREEEGVMTVKEYLQWTEEVLGGGDRGEGSSPCLEDVQEYFSGYMHIFEQASSSASESLQGLKMKLAQDMDALELSSEPSPEEEEERRERLLRCFKEEGMAVKAAAQHRAGLQIEALTRRRRERYLVRLRFESSQARQAAVIEAVRAEAVSIATSISTINSLENYHVMMVKEIIFTKEKIDKVSDSGRKLQETNDKILEIITQLKLRRSLLSERLSVLSSELYITNQTADSLQKQISHLSAASATSHASEIQMNRLEAKQEMIKGEKDRLMRLLDSCALESGWLMKDQIQAEDHLAQLESRRAVMEQQSRQLTACGVFLEEKEVEVRRVLQGEGSEPDVSPGVASLSFQDEVKRGPSSEMLVASTIRSQAEQYSTLIDLACFKVEELQAMQQAHLTAERVESRVAHLRAEQEDIEAKLLSSRAKIDLNTQAAAELHAQARREVEQLQCSKRALEADIARARLEQKRCSQQALSTSGQVERQVAELTQQQEHAQAALQEAMERTCLAKEEARATLQQSRDDLAELERSKSHVIADIDCAKLKVNELNTSIDHSQEKAELVRVEADEKVKVSRALVEQLDTEVARLQQVQARVQLEVEAAQKRSDQLLQEAEESRMRAMRLTRDSREEVEQLRRGQAEAEAQVEAVVEMTENMILEAEQEKARLSSEREEALEKAYEARCRVEALEAEVAALKASRKDSTLPPRGDGSQRVSYAPTDSTMSGISVTPRRGHSSDRDRDRDRDRDGDRDRDRDRDSFRTVWEKCADEDGDTFYYNRDTEESTWTRPQCFDPPSRSDSSSDLDLDLVSVEGKHFQRVEGGEEGDSYWINDDTGSILEDDSKLKRALRSEKKSLAVAKEKQNELNRLSEASRLELEKNAEDIKAAQNKAKAIADEMEAVRLKAEQSVLEANTQVEWTQLLVDQSHDDLAVLSDEQRAVNKEVEVAQSQSRALSREAERGPDEEAERPRTTPTAEDTAEDTREDSGEERQALPIPVIISCTTAQEGLISSDKDSDKAAMLAAVNFKQEEEQQEEECGGAQSKRRVSADWEECEEDEEEGGGGGGGGDASGEDSSSIVQSDVSNCNCNCDGKRLQRVEDGEGGSYWVNEETGSICDD
jgi:hypothetical protein